MVEVAREGELDAVARRFEQPLQQRRDLARADLFGGPDVQPEGLRAAQDDPVVGLELIESLGYGPGVSIVRFSGIIDTLAVSSTTPIDAGSCVTRFDFYTRSIGDAETNSNVAQAFVREVDRQFMEDMPVWEHKAHITRPALADTDGPFMAFRRWYQQFYAEVDPSTDVDPNLFPPPHWPEKMDETPAKATASARHGSS